MSKFRRMLISMINKSTPVEKELKYVLEGMLRLYSSNSLLSTTSFTGIASSCTGISMEYTPSISNQYMIFQFYDLTPEIPLLKIEKEGGNTMSITNNRPLEEHNDSLYCTPSHDAYVPFDSTLLIHFKIMSDEPFSLTCPTFDTTDSKGDVSTNYNNQLESVIRCSDGITIDPKYYTTW